MRILLIVHDTSNSGAPKSVLLIFEELIKKGYEITIVSLKGGGILEDRFKLISKAYYRLDLQSKKHAYSLKSRIKSRIFRKNIVSEYEKVLNLIAENSFEYIYANTVVSLDLALKIKHKTTAKLLLHVHELNTVIDEFAPNLNTLDSFIDLYIVPSEMNKDCLTQQFLINKSKIHIVRETSNLVTKKSSKTNDSFNILMCGASYWRKGDDIFLLIAKKVLESEKNIFFYWLGYQSDERKRVNKSDIKKFKIEENVFFIDETNEIEKWYDLADLFLLTSREDPFPLAAIDAGMKGLPILCFENATGISEVIDKVCVVDYLNIEAMATVIISFFNDSVMYNEISIANSKKFTEFSPEKVSIEILSLLENNK